MGGERETGKAEEMVDVHVDITHILHRAPPLARTSIAKTTLHTRAQTQITKKKIKKKLHLFIKSPFFPSPPIPSQHPHQFNSIHITGLPSSPSSSSPSSYATNSRRPARPWPTKKRMCSYARVFLSAPGLASMSSAAAAAAVVEEVEVGIARRGFSGPGRRRACVVVVVVIVLQFGGNERERVLEDVVVVVVVVVVVCLVIQHMPMCIPSAAQAKIATAMMICEIQRLRSESW